MFGMQGQTLTRVTVDVYIPPPSSVLDSGTTLAEKSERKEEVGQVLSGVKGAGGSDGEDSLFQFGSITGWGNGSIRC